jgi:hypothetical protein
MEGVILAVLAITDPSRSMMTNDTLAEAAVTAKAM